MTNNKETTPVIPYSEKNDREQDEVSLLAFLFNMQKPNDKQYTIAEITTAFPLYPASAR